MPDDLDVIGADSSLHGTARLVRSALQAPPPPNEAEAESRRQVEMLMQEAALSPKVLREAVRDQPRRSWWRKFFARE